MTAEELVKAVVDILKSRQQLELLPQVAEGLAQAALTQPDPHLATVTSAAVLSSAQKQILTKTLKKLFKRPLRLKTRLDPALIGGLRIDLAGRVVDLSLAKQLDDINEATLYD